MTVALELKSRRLDALNVWPAVTSIVPSILEIVYAPTVVALVICKQRIGIDQLQAADGNRDAAGRQGKGGV